METVHKTQSFKTIDLIYSALFATLIMIGANITSFVPFLTVGGVPITLQAFFAILAGLVLGAKKVPLHVQYICLSGWQEHRYSLNSRADFPRFYFRLSALS